MVTTKQAAESWGVTPLRVRQLIKQGRIPGCTKVGRDWLVPEDATYPKYKRVWFRKPT